MARFYEQWRSIEHFWDDPDWLRERMLFVSGPRQVGKTTLVTHSLCTEPRAYFNWDSRTVRLAYQQNPDFIEGLKSKWICFDEIHKRPHWKDILKGVYDTHKSQYHFVITGSARLETFKRSGDSLVGRYFHTTLFPLNLPDFHKQDFELPHHALELLKTAADSKDSSQLQGLLDLGGFPEPYFSGSATFWKRWSANHRDLIIREDLRSLKRLTELDKIEVLLEALAPSVGKTLSYRDLGNDLETGHSSVKRWLEALNTVQLVFSVPPYSKNVRRAFKQERKWFYTDWCAATENRFENYVAATLLRACVLYTDRFGDKMELKFVRTFDDAEVDFLVCKDKQPWLLVEAKAGAPDVSSAVYRFCRELKVPCAVVTPRPNIARYIRGDSGEQIYCLSWGKLGRLLP
jgi:predicted AAA+ superfamily ATPase